MSSSLQTLLLEEAGKAAFLRGAEYARDGRIVIEAADATRLQATAHGTDRYLLTLRWQEGRLLGECECPVGQRDEFCKHQVAAALVWASPLESARKFSRTSRTVDVDVLETWLQQQSDVALRSLLHALARNHRDGGPRSACAGPHGGACSH